MNLSPSSEASLEQKLQQLEEQLVKTERPSIDQFHQAYQELRKLSRKLEELLQWASEQHRSEEEFGKLYRQIVHWNASELIESLKTTGLKFKQNRDRDLKDAFVKDAFDRQGYRILELVRAGKRDEVFHAILRIFVSVNREFPTCLVEAFKLVYSDELFKVFLFSFLSGVLGEERETESPLKGGSHEH